VFQPVLFGLIGTEIDLSQLEGNTILYGLCVLAVGLMVSIVLSVGVMMSFAGLFLKMVFSVLLQ
jgi:hypothetical protein